MYMCDAYYMAHRTTILLDEETRRAARELAARYDCSLSEAIRRAIHAQRQQVLGVSAERRRERLHAFHRLIELFDGHDPEREISELKDEDEHA
jgi:hypothetical protein